jgi:hypothetical protein
MGQESNHFVNWSGKGALTCCGSRGQESSAGEESSAPIGAGFGIVDSFPAIHPERAATDAGTD